MAREMKKSGVQWIEEIPSHWEVRRLRTLGSFSASGIDKNIIEGEPLIHIINYVDVYNNKEFVLGHKDYMVVSAPQSKVFEHQVHVGDMIFTPSSETKDDIGVSAVVMEELPNTAYSYHVLRFRFFNENDVDIKYRKYFCNNRYVGQYFTTCCNGTIRQTLSRLDFKDCQVFLPPLAEQQAIADFLDAKCAEIDGLLADLDAELKTLAEYKKSIIAETVTHGLNPNVPMKSSGIPWAESIPAHWRVQKGKYTFSLLQRPVKEDDGVVTCFRDGEVTLRSNRREDGFTMSAKEYGYQGIEPGDLVVHGMDGFAGAIGISDSRGKGTPVLNVLDSYQNKRYLMYYLRNMAYGDVFLALSTGIRVRSCDLGWKKLGEIRIVLPPIEEQNQIAEYIDRKLVEIQNAVSNKLQQIETLKAYKASLIYEYVTGKKQVI